VAREGLARDLFAKYPDGVVYKGEVWPSWAYFPDFTSERTRTWWGEKLTSFVRTGVAGIWNDMNEPAVWGKSVPDIVRFSDEGNQADHRKIHNVYALQMAKATFDALKAQPDRRPFILTRAGFAGIQRYAAVWTGDNVASEEHLALACLMPQSMGISGVPFVGTDVGGFGGYPSRNLYVRWMQLGAFTPFFRAHSAINEPQKEPWAFGEEAETLCREAIAGRYRLLPYLYGEFRSSARTGLPIMRPLMLSFQDDPECYSDGAQKQFTVGRSLLVAPVLSAHETFRQVYLPAGRWMQWWDRKVVEGKRWITVEAPLSRIPVFLGEGGIVPMQEAQNHVGEKKLTEMEFEVFPSTGSVYELYEDDGESRRYKDGAYATTRIEVSREAGGELTIRAARTHDRHDSGRKTYLFRVADVSRCAKVTLDGRPLEPGKTRESARKGPPGYFFDPESRTLQVTVPARFPLEVRVMP